MNWYKIITSSSSIPVDFIYDTFTIQFLPNQFLTEDDQFVIDYRMQTIKENLIANFKSLMIKQIEKYLSRPDRYLQDKKQEIISTYQNGSFTQLAKIFNQLTTRSANHRSYSPEDIYNTNWGNIALSLASLEKMSSAKEIAQSLANPNGLFNLIHNTGTVVLDKFVNGNQLLKALDECNNAKYPIEFINKMSKPIAKIAGRKEMRKLN